MSFSIFSCLFSQKYFKSHHIITIFIACTEWHSFFFSVLQNLFSYSVSRAPLGCLCEREHRLGIRCVCGHVNPVTCFFTHTALHLNALKHAYKPWNFLRRTVSLAFPEAYISIYLIAFCSKKAGAALSLLTTKQQPSKFARPAILAGSLWSQGAPGSRA